MTFMKASNLSLTRMISRSIALVLALSLAVGTVPVSATAGVDNVINNQASTITQGEVTTKEPRVSDICAALRNAANGNFVDENGKQLETIDSDCAAQYTYRTDQAKNCSKPLSEVIKIAQKQNAKVDLDALCTGAIGRLSSKVETYCTLRNITQTSQAITYCDARDSAENALKSLQIVRGLDVAAAAACWTEYVTWKAAQATSGGKLNSIAGAFGQLQGACGGASIAAGLGELTQVALGLTAEKGSSRFASRNTTGEYKINSEGPNEKKGFNVAKAMETLLAAGGSMKGIQIGVCYYWPEKYPELCKGTHDTQHGKKITKAAEEAYEVCGTTYRTANAKLKAILKAKSDAQYAMVRKKAAGEMKPNLFGFEKQGNSSENSLQGGPSCTAQDIAELDSAIEVAKYEEQKALKDAVDTRKGSEAENIAKVELAHQAAIIFSGLAAMRTISIASANTTQKRADQVLKSMFNPSNANVTMGIGGSVSNSLPNLFSATNVTYNMGTNPATKQAASIATPGSPEAFLRPPGSPMSATAERVANRIPAAAIEAMDAGNFGAGMAAAAQAAGAPSAGLGTIRSEAGSLFASIPKDDSGGGYKLGGGGGGKAPAKESTPDLNLKALFGGEGEKKEDVAQNELAFRNPAAEEDIWHSQNPKGNNLFQIISEKYDGVQRKSVIGPGL
jgi:hypothetical protein